MYEKFGKGSLIIVSTYTPVTKPSSYTSFCIDFTYSTKTGDNHCVASYKKGGEESARIGNPYIYTCHAGLILGAPVAMEQKVTT